MLARCKSDITIKNEQSSPLRKIYYFLFIIFSLFFKKALLQNEAELLILFHLALDSLEAFHYVVAALTEVIVENLILGIELIVNV